MTLRRCPHLTALYLAVLDEGLAEQVAVDCHDLAHDPRYCSTCSKRAAGIEDYRLALFRAAGIPTAPGAEGGAA